MIAPCGYAIVKEYTLQARAITKRITTNFSYAIGNCNARQVGAIRERTLTDGGYAIADYDACQVMALIKRIITDGSHAIGNCEFSSQAGAITERPLLDGGYTIGNLNTRQAGASIERSVSDGSYAIGDCKTCITFANCIGYQNSSIFRVKISVNGLVSWILIIYNNACKACAVLEGVNTNDGNVLRDVDTCQVETLAKRIIADGGYAIGDCNTYKLTIVERTRADACEATAKRDSRNIVSFWVFAGKCIVANAYNTIGNCNARQAGAIIERPLIDGGYAIGNVNARQTEAIRERILADGGYAIADCEFRQAGAIIERRIADLGYAVGNCKLSR